MSTHDPRATLRQLAAYKLRFQESGSRLWWKIETAKSFGKPRAEFRHRLRPIHSGDFSVAKCPHPLIGFPNPGPPQCGRTGGNAFHQPLDQQRPLRIRKQKGFLFKNCRVHIRRLTHHSRPVNPWSQPPPEKIGGRCAVSADFSKSRKQPRRLQLAQRLLQMLPLQLVLPDPHDRPAVLPQQPVLPPVPRFVPFDLRQPP